MTDRQPFSERRLMIPGPVPVDDAVLQVMASPLVPHYGAEWTAFYRETLRRLQSVYQTAGRVFVLVGSGSAGLDAALGSTLYPDAEALVVENGFFGERLVEIAQSYSSRVRTLSFRKGHPADVDAVLEELDRAPVDAVVIAHCETSTGVLNPIDRLAEGCRERDTLLIVDAISTLGIEPLAMDDWGVDLCVAASQKGLDAPPGLATVAVGERAWRRIERGSRPGWYLNLSTWARYESEWGDWHPHPVTHAVNNVRALHLALERILDEGLESRFERHRRVTGKLREGIQRMGMRPLVEEEHASHGVTSVVAPIADLGALLEAVQARHRILLAGSLGELKGKVFRIGHMGPGATEDAVEDVLAALEETLAARGDWDRERPAHQ